MTVAVVPVPREPSALTREPPRIHVAHGEQGSLPTPGVEDLQVAVGALGDGGCIRTMAEIRKRRRR
ncbi:MAG: hypothetical protein FJ090_09475 [Deltaproteobacteria bacterium]|nr:hypothetical protein [Deltaproteobacteria bacterium]MBM4391341.1 hypothetical protein [Deltaproteobacteria bacterium]